MESKFRRTDVFYVWFTYVACFCQFILSKEGKYSNESNTLWSAIVVKTHQMKKEEREILDKWANFSNGKKMQFHDFIILGTTRQKFACDLAILVTSFMET